MRRIAILEISQESNSFSAAAGTLADFQRTYLYYNEDLIQHLRGTGTEIGGFLDVLEARTDFAAVPILAAHAVPSGPSSQATIVKLAQDLISGLKKAGPLDGVLAALHGAMLGEEEADPEGYFLEAIRQAVGDIPVIATLDLHGHVTPGMVDQATALIGYRHYPHDDTFETGQRAAVLLIDTIMGKVKPMMAMSKVPMLVPVNNSQTNSGPMLKLVEEEHRLERDSAVLSASSFPVQPWLDTPNTGFATIVITDNNLQRAKDEAAALAELAKQLCDEFHIPTFQVDQAIRMGMSLSAPKQPFLLVDTADAPGGGSTGDSTYVLERILALSLPQKCFMTIVDPQAAAEAASAGAGRSVRLSVGNRLDPRRGQPIEIEGIVKHISDGDFIYRGGLFDGSAGRMGLSAVLETGNISLLIVSRATYEWDDIQYRSVGLNPAEAKFLVIKNPLNYKFTYRHITDIAFILDSPGPCSPDFLKYDFRKITRPLYPFDPISSVKIRTYPSRPTDKTAKEITR